MKIKIINFLQIIFSHRAKIMYASYFKSYWTKNKKSYCSARKHNESPRLIFLPVPILNNKYWANALKKKQIIADTLMTGYFSISFTICHPYWD